MAFARQGTLAIPRDHPENPRREFSFFREHSWHFTTRIGRGSWCIGRFGIPPSGNAAQSRTLPSGARRSRSKVRPRFSHFTIAYYQSVRLETARWREGEAKSHRLGSAEQTYTTGISKRLDHVVKVALVCPICISKPHHRGLGPTDPCLDIECGYFRINDKFKLQILWPR